MVDPADDGVERALANAMSQDAAARGAWIMAGRMGRAAYACYADAHKAVFGGAFDETLSKILSHLAPASTPFYNSV